MSDAPHGVATRDAALRESLWRFVQRHHRAADWRPVDGSEPVDEPVLCATVEDGLHLIGPMLKVGPMMRAHWLNLELPVPLGAWVDGVVGWYPHVLEPPLFWLPPR